MMSEMVERVAKALAEGNYQGKTYESWEEGFKESFRAMARIAIRAMKDPDVRVAYYPGENLYGGGFWDNMIDEMLKEE